MELQTPEHLDAPLRSGATAKLRGGRCSHCGYVAFPRYEYGCERCGAAGLDAFALSGRGIVRVSVAVHRTRDGIPEGVASIALDEGPVIRALLCDADPLAPPGTRVHAVVAPLRHKTEVLGLRFDRSE